MTYPLSHFTLQDDSLTHQVRFTVSNNTVWVSCNCRYRPRQNEHHVNGTTFSHDPIGPTRNIEESRKLYNDPVNHWGPFTDADKAKW